MQSFVYIYSTYSLAHIEASSEIHIVGKYKKTDLFWCFGEGDGGGTGIWTNTVRVPLYLHCPADVTPTWCHCHQPTAF